MNNKMGLSLIADDGTATREYAWLKLMAGVKYDDYSDFRAGVRFIESLATWLKQFAPEHRQTAYDFIKHRLIYISSAEMQKVIEAFVPEVVTPALRAVVAAEMKVAPYEVWQSPESAKLFRARLHRTLFIGLSDGSRIDVLRRANSRRISTEQVVPILHIDDEKWKDLGETLEKEEGGGAKFDRVYLIDDFTASGTTFLRRPKDEWKGKLVRFNKIVAGAATRLGEAFPIATNFSVHIHHYIASAQAKATLDERLALASETLPNKMFSTAVATEGLLLPKNAVLAEEADSDVLELCERYYDDQVYQRYKKHCDEAGQSDMKRGYANCALPVVLAHNTPNNTVPLVWAETDGASGHSMKPVFRRRDRHG
jgi:hypothetical protein